MEYELSLEEIQDEGYKMLCAFSDYCKDNNLKFSLGYGTLLGAVRYNDFLPWDDDVDIIMPRPDYTRLLELSNISEALGEEYKLINYENGEFKGTYTKLINKRIKIKHSSLEGYVDNFFIDINPFDGVPENYRKFKIRVMIADIWKNISFLSMARLSYGKDYLKKIAKCILKPIAKMVGARYSIKRVFKLMLVQKYEDSYVVGGIVEPDFKGYSECVPKNQFEETIDIRFRDRSFPAMSCYESFLKGKFGDDYMIFIKKLDINKHYMRVWRPV